MVIRVLSTGEDIRVQALTHNKSLDLLGRRHMSLRLLCFFGHDSERHGKQGSVYSVTRPKTITQGFDTIKANLLTAPAYAWAAIVYFTLAVASDRYQRRVMILIPAGLVTMCAPSFIFSEN